MVTISSLTHIMCFVSTIILCRKKRMNEMSPHFFTRKDPGSSPSARVHSRQLETGRHCRYDTLPLHLSGTLSQKPEKWHKAPSQNLHSDLYSQVCKTPKLELLVLHQLPLNFLFKEPLVSITVSVTRSCHHLVIYLSVALQYLT